MLNIGMQKGGQGKSDLGNKICDIDFFRNAPVINDKVIEWFGTKRLKAPEEYIEGSVTDKQTNIFTLGALIFEFFLIKSLILSHKVSRNRCHWR